MQAAPDRDFYIPISFKDEYDYLQSYPEPAILREPIMRVVLQIANMGRSIRTAELIDKPDDEKIDTAIRQLKLIGCLDEEEKITKEGELVVKFPTDPERTRMLITADQLGVLPEAVIVAATIEEEGFFYYPKEYDKREKADRERRELAQGNGDYVAIVNAYRLFKRAEKEIQDEIREERRSNGGKAVGNLESRMRDWCIEHNINFKRIRIVENTISQLREEINSSPLKLENGIAAEREFDPELLIKSALSGQLNDVSVYRAGARSSQFESDRGNFDLSFGSTCPRDAKLILTGGSLSKVAVKGSSTVHRLLSDTASPIKPEWLEDIFPHLCRREALGDLRYEPKTDEVWETARLRFNGRDIAAFPVRSENDESASEVLAKWLAENVTVASENPLRDVLQANLAQREGARLLNVRNGSVIFPDYPSSVLAGYYTDKLNGARSIREISNPQALLLPEPDNEAKELMELVKSENPETIEVCGRQKSVEYQLNQKPRIVVDYDEEADFYHQLPDDGVYLPGGRKVVFCVGSRYHPTKAESDNMQAVKNGIRISQNYEQWTNWRDRPEIAQPDFNDESSTIPDIVEVNYGNCVLTGEPLTAYGVVVVHVSRPYYSYSNTKSTIYGEIRWCQNKAEADRERQLSVTELEKYRETRQKELEQERVAKEQREFETTCREKRSKLQEVAYHHYYDSLDYEYRQKISDLMTSLRYPSEDAEERRDLIAETDDLLTRLPNMLAAAEKRAEQDRTDRERINQLMEEEYPCCPVCGQEWYQGRRDCECEGVLRADTGLVKASYAPDGNIVAAARIYSEYGRNYLRVEAESRQNVPELSEIKTETLYRSPRESREGDRNGTDGGLPDGADDRDNDPDMNRPPNEDDIAALMERFNNPKH